jgi:hypothetical protein
MGSQILCGNMCPDYDLVYSRNQLRSQLICGFHITVSSEFYIKGLNVLVFPPDFNKFDWVLHFDLTLV